jgi:hypothetical protein
VAFLEQFWQHNQSRIAKPPKKSQKVIKAQLCYGNIFSRERSSTGSNDCFVVVVVLVLVLVVFYPLVIFKSKSLFVPCYGTF